jgi:anion-transporting  ArsA/GET3 family ATPase
MAIEEMCRLDESDDYDLLVIDTPPAGHAIDFLRAPERIERLLRPEVLGWILRPRGGAGAGAVGAVAGAVRRLLLQLERAAGPRALHEITAFFVAMEAMLGDVAGRARRARQLLHGDATGFVLVTAPGERVLRSGASLTASMRAQWVPLRAMVINRVHRVPAGEDGELSAVLAELEDPGADAPMASWLRERWEDAVRLDGIERDRIHTFTQGLDPNVARAEVAELDHDAHSLPDLIQVAHRLGVLDHP